MNPLRAYLSKHAITGSAFAERIGLSPGFLSRLMSGDREADATVLAKIEIGSGGAVTPDLWVAWWRAQTETSEDVA